MGRGREKSAVHGPMSEAVVELGRAFRAFRASAVGARPRVPDGLRARVMAALEEGCPERELLRACGLTKAQVRQWSRSRASGVGRPARAARVLRIAEDDPGASARASLPVRVEVRLGRWCIHLQRAGG